MDFASRVGRGILVLSVAGWGFGCQSEEKLNWVGVDRTGKEVAIPGSLGLLGKTLNRSFEKNHRGVLRSAAQFESEAAQFELARVTAGLKVELEGEIESVAELGGEAVLELRYQPLRAPKGGLQ